VLYAPERFQRSLGLVLSGQVRVTRGEIVVALLERGDWFGAAALFNDREEFPSTLTAVGACQALYLSQETVAQLLERWPTAAENYIRYLSGRIGFLSDRLNSLAAGTAEEKVKQFLLRQADETGTVTASADDLAKALGLGRASIYRAFESLEGQGVLSRRGRIIHLARTKIKME
jgi:CRP-like cAMP-binding protein